MSDTTVVNPQITDAVTQSNVKVLGEAPAMAIGSLYQTIANSVGMALANAVYAQQQANVIAQAAAAQGVMLLYSLDATAAAAATPSAIDAASIEQHALQSSAALKNAGESAQSALQPQIEAAVKFANDSALENAGRFAYALRNTAEAAATGLSDIARVNLQQCMGILQTAATAMCLQAMLRHPEKAEDYERVMRTIREMA
jgi:Killing trait